MSCIELFKYNKFYSSINTKPDITQYTIYGERHSGTNWLAKIIKKNFDLPLTWKYDHKHFFGCCDWSTINNANNILFIGIVRNIYGWIKGMYRIPYHLESKHILNINPWKSTIGNNIQLCDSHWYTKELYDDIFDMRYHKLYFLNYIMPYLATNFILLRYEDLILHYEDIINQIEHTYNLNRKYPTNNTYPDFSKINLQSLPDGYIETINQRTRWDMENHTGYSKINSIENDYCLQ
jgi:hypothetical protein